MAINRNFSSIDINDNAKFRATLGAGKVRQMFDERRQRSNTGIDKSYPLQPISSRKSPLPPTTNAVKLDMDKLNGNTFISNKQYGFGDSLDNEKFPEFFEDDSMQGHKSAVVKLPNVGKPISNLNKSNGNVKLKPVVKNNVVTPDTVPKRSINTKKLVPVAMRPPSDPQPLLRSVKSVIGIPPQPSISSTNIVNKTQQDQSVTNARNATSPNEKTSRPPPKTPPENMSACEKCGRFFNEDRIERHENICKKQKKRSVFDATKHRVKGTEVELPPPPPSDTSDYIQCPHCSRRFNQSAADRHIPKCANFQHNKPKPVPKKRF